MKLGPIALLALLAFTGAGLAWWVRNSLPASDAIALSAPLPAPEEPARALTSFEPTAAERATPEAVTPPEADSAGGRRQSAANAHDSAASEDVILVTGRVVVPLGTPRDEVLRIAASGRRLANGEYTHFSNVAPDGRFSARFKEGTKVGKLRLESRYLLLEGPRLLLDLPLKECVLEPELGGRVRVRVLPPALPFGEIREFSRARAQIRSLSGGGIGVQLDAEGCFEHGPLRAAKGYSLHVESPDWVDAQVGFELRPGEVVELEVTLELGARIAGRVLGPDGAGLAYVELAARSTLDGEDAAARRSVRTRTDFAGRSVKAATDLEGRFEVNGLRAGEVELTATLTGFAAQSTQLGTLRDGELREDVLIQLGAGLAVEGRVRWPDGRPATSANVELAPTVTPPKGRSERRPVLKLATDEHGRFRFAGLEPGTCELRASARPERAEARSSRSREPLWAARIDALPAGTHGVELVLDGGSSLHGRVIDDAGVPLPNFTIRASPESLGSTLRRSFSGSFEDPEGRLELGGFEPGVWSVRVDAPGALDSPTVLVRMPHEGAELVFIVTRAARVAGRVRSPAGEPFAGATVWAYQSGRETDGYRRGHTAAKSDAQGGFKYAKAKPGTWLFVARADGFAASRAVEVRVEPGGAVDGIVLDLRRGARVEGSLRLASGKVADRTIHISGPSDSASARTDALGEFRFEDLAPGRHRVWLELSEEERAGGLLASRYTPDAHVELAEGELARIVLPAPPVDALTVHGRVTAAGEPLAGLEIVWTSGGEVGPRSAHTDAQGRYRTALDRPGEWILQVARDGQPFYGERVSVPDRKVHAHDVELPIGAISGSVRDERGRGLAGVSLRAWRQHDPEASRWTSARTVTTDERGRFACEHLLAGTYILSAGGDDRHIERDEDVRLARVEIELAEGQRREGIELVLAPGGTITGRVLDRAGFLVENIIIELRDARGQGVTSAYGTRGDGSFRLRGLAAGDYLLVVSKGEDVRAQQAVRVEAGRSVTVELTLPL